MNIQISVTIWTVICFVLLMLILHHLLFKPILRVMDQRRERIEKAAAKKAEHEKMAAEFKKALAEKQAAVFADQKKQLKARVEQIRAQGKQAVEVAKEQRMQDVEAYHAKADAERERILQALRSHSHELAVSFAKSVTKE